MANLVSLWSESLMAILLIMAIKPNDAAQQPSNGECPSDCSWTAYEASTQEEAPFNCTVSSSKGHFSCPALDTPRTLSVADRPEEVGDLITEYYTQNISSANGIPIYRVCLRVRFTLDPSTARNIDGIQVSLLSKSYHTYGDTLCRQIQFPSGQLSYCSVLTGNCDHNRKRVFTVGCLCDLFTGDDYQLTVKTLPEDNLTGSLYSASITTPISVPDCDVFPSDQWCPRGLSVWIPSHSSSHQEADYSSMTTCFTLPPPEAEEFFVFLYSYQPNLPSEYQPVRAPLLNRTGVAKQTVTVDGESVELACITFSGLRTNMSYEPAFRLELAAGSTDDEPTLKYLDKSRLFLIDNPCDTRPCREGTCISEGPTRSCICNRGAVYISQECRRDTEDPQVSNCPSTIEVSSDPGRCSAALTWPALNVSDNSGRTVHLDYQSHRPGQSFPVGDTSVEYLYTDEANNTAACVFKVSVFDEEAPLVEPCDQPIRARLREGETHVRVSWDIIAEDNCGEVASNLSLHGSQLFSLGTTDVSYRVWDQSSNERICSLSVHVIAAPFNLFRLFVIAGTVLVLGVIIAAFLWRNRSRLKAFKAFLKSHQPYSISVEGSHHPGPSVRERTLSRPCEDPINTWLSRQHQSEHSSVPDTLSQEEVCSSHLKYEPAVLIVGREELLQTDALEETNSGEEEKEEDGSMQECDSLIGLGCSAAGRDSGLVTSRL